MRQPIVVGQLDQRVIDLFALPLVAGTPIYTGESNVAHMMEKHPEDFARYGDRLEDILRSPDYIAKHPRKDSIEYIKIFHDHVTDEHVLVAVRASVSGVLYARSLFVMTQDKTRKYRDKGALISLGGMQYNESTSNRVR